MLAILVILGLAAVGIAFFVGFCFFVGMLIAASQSN